MKKHGGVAVLFAALLALVMAGTNCSREYSLEGRKADTLGRPDSLPLPLPPPYAGCAACRQMTVLDDSAWRFQAGATVYCGRNAKAVLSPDKTGFTFFGPSACAADSGFIVTVYLPEPLVTNKTALRASGVVFYYYDRLAQDNVLVSKPGFPFTLVVEEYDAQKGRGVVRFNGTAFTKNGDGVAVSEGRFVMRF